MWYQMNWLQVDCLTNQFYLPSFYLEMSLTIMQMDSQSSLSMLSIYSRKID